MKKLLSILLALAMLSPAVLSAGAADAAEKPFYGLGWSDFNEEKYPNMDGLITLSFDVQNDIVDLSSSGSSKPEKMAAKIKAVTDARPEGLRYLHFFKPGTAIAAGAENIIFLDKGVEQMRDLTEAFFREYHAIGGKVDGAVMCTLYTGLSSWYIQMNHAAKDPLAYNRIVQDPRYATQIRPLLVERGFPFWEDVSDYTPEIYSISPDAGSQYGTASAIWDAVMRIHLSNYINQWIYEPMTKYFPDAVVSDYQAVDSDPWLKGVNDDGNLTGTGGHVMKVGNASSCNFYVSRPSARFFNPDGSDPVYKNPPSYNDAIYEDSKFNVLLYEINMGKRAYASTDTKHFSAWVNEYSAQADITTVTNSPYFSERMYHVGLLDPKPFVMFIYREYYDDARLFDESVQVTSQLLAELTRVAGFADRTPIELPISWNNEFVLSGMYAGGRNIWRITPNTDLVSVADFKTDASDPTFRVKGQTVTFPQGKIIEDTAISQIGTCGYWVETPADVYPVVTSDADRFEKFPAYLEDFQSYEAGSQFTVMTAREKGVWLVKTKGNIPTIAADGENQSLVFTGNTSIQQQKLPANITAGDSYAKEQIWEVTVTIPESLNPDAEIVLLNYTGSKQSTTDGGFKLSGGKVYYDQNGEYLELSKVTLTAGKYTFKRVMHLTGEDVFTCDYIVCDGNGKVLRSHTGVAVATCQLPVKTIGMSCTNVNGNVLLDDYALRAAGVAADFELYNALTGMKIAAEDMAYLQNQNVAYRLSWLNATHTQETATVMAAVYEGETLISETVVQEIVMLPGHDSVETGIVQVSEGQSVLVYLKTPEKNAPAANGGMSATLLIVVIAAAVVLITAAAVAAVIVVKKKSTAEE